MMVRLNFNLKSFVFSEPTAYGKKTKQNKNKTKQNKQRLQTKKQTKQNKTKNFDKQTKVQQQSKTKQNIESALCLD